MYDTLPQRPELLRMTGAVVGTFLSHVFPLKFQRVQLTVCSTIDRTRSDSVLLPALLGRTAHSWGARDFLHQSTNVEGHHVYAQPDRANRGLLPM